MKISLRNRVIALRRLAGDLAKDTAGNALAIVAASVVPIAALAGSGIDLSRAYTAQARLQMACDAASLAGRRAMTAGAVDTTVRNEALKFFRFNFETGEGGRTPAFGVASFVPVVEDGASSAVVVRASTTVPTTIMSMFGYTNIPISVTCNARQDFVNTDVVLVLDTTGSMAQKAVSTDTQTKIEGIRSAVLALYDELAPAQTQLEAVGLRLRYGIVPYSVTVNVGNAIKAVSSSYIVDSWDYQSRKWEWDGTSYSSSTSNGTWSTTSTTYNPSSGYTTESTTTGVASNTCTARSDTSTNYGSETSGSSTTTTDANGVRTTTTPATRSGTYTDYNDTWTRTSGNGNNALGTCVRRSRTVTVNQSRTATVTETPQYAWVYKQVNYPTNQFKLGVSVSTPTGNNGANISSTWRGCIEERATDSSITSSTTAATPDAHDLNIDEIPTHDGNKWRPHWPEVVYRRNSTSDADATPNASTGTAITSAGSNYWACPTEAKRLQSWTKANLTTYVNSLNADGYTYHDIGMIWGARFISSGGIFAGDNPTTYQNMPVAKYIIYMTDGQLDTEPNAYTAYGEEYLDQRVSGNYTTTGDLDNRHRKRFSLACDAAKSIGANVWVVSFATTLSTELTNCASKPTQAKVSANSAALIQDFAKIGKEIGALRLTK